MQRALKSAENSRPFFIIGHRGAAGHVHENTIASFVEALNLKADMVELDVRFTADEKLVLFHDEVIRATGGRSKLISKISFAELKEIASTLGFALASLEELFDLLAKKIPLVIEIKSAGFESELLNSMAHFNFCPQTVISSFHPEILNRLNEIKCPYNIALIIGRGDLMTKKILNKRKLSELVTTLKIEALHLQGSIISEQLVASLKEMGIKIFAWTVDEPDSMKKLIRLGIDGIITNKPDILYNVCLELSQELPVLMCPAANSVSRFAYRIM